MHKKMWKFLILLLVIPGLLVTVSCSKKTIKSEPVITTPSSPDVDNARREAEQLAEMERQKRLAEENRLREEALMEAKRASSKEKIRARVQFLNEDVYFDFDSDTLTMQAQQVLKNKAKWLMANPREQALIEGHCDERGTNAYNLALGDRRALSAKNFLINLGISETRMTTVSYGEERPINDAHTEAAWAKNRRAHFILQ